MIRAMAGRLPLMLAALVVFTATFAAASSLSVSQLMTPAAGTGDGTNCQDGAIGVGYSISDGSVTSLDITGVSAACVGSWLSLRTETSAYFPAEDPEASSGSTITFEITEESVPDVSIAIGIDGGGGGVPIADFTTGSITVVILPSGVTGSPW